MCVIFPHGFFSGFFFFFFHFIGKIRSEKFFNPGKFYDSSFLTKMKASSFELCLRWNSGKDERLAFPSYLILSKIQINKWCHNKSETKVFALPTETSHLEKKPQKTQHFLFFSPQWYERHKAQNSVFTSSLNPHSWGMNCKSYGLCCHQYMNCIKIWKKTEQSNFVVTLFLMFTHNVPHKWVVLLLKSQNLAQWDFTRKLSCQISLTGLIFFSKC